MLLVLGLSNLLTVSNNTLASDVNKAEIRAVIREELRNLFLNLTEKPTSPLVIHEQVLDNGSDAIYMDNLSKGLHFSGHSSSHLFY
jgi:hypothetical protein